MPMQCAMVTHISVNHNRERYFVTKNISLQKNIYCNRKIFSSDKNIIRLFIYLDHSAKNCERDQT